LLKVLSCSRSRFPSSGHEATRVFSRCLVTSSRLNGDRQFRRSSLLPPTMSFSQTLTSTDILINGHLLGPSFDGAVVKFEVLEPSHRLVESFACNIDFYSSSNSRQLALNIGDHRDLEFDVQRCLSKFAVSETSVPKPLMP
jgi:hypothetical protein